ncbi:MAG: DNA polymerase I [Candidatus Eisenbacteria bacterium]
MAKMLLVDGPAIAYRSHFALARMNLTTAKGQSTAATYGFVTTLLKLLREHCPTHANVAFDTEKPTYRHDLFEEYKAGRPGMPDELAAQLGWIKETTEALGVRVLELDGYEADDIIATLARMARRADLETLIATGDKDLLQLVDDKTRVIMLSGSSRDTGILDQEGVLAKYEIAPALLADLLGLMGDAVDNVPGVPGIGQKTATQLVKTYGTLEAIYENLDHISPAKVQTILREHRDKAFGSRMLTRVHTEVPLGVTLEDLARRSPREGDLKRIFADLGFRSLLRQVVARDPESATRPHVWEEPFMGSTTVKVECPGVVAIEVNLADGPTAVAPVVGVAISCEGAGDYYFPLKHREPANISTETLEEAVGGLLRAPDRPKVVHDAKRVLLAMRNLGIEVPNIEFDSLLARYLLNPGQGGLDVEDIALEYLGSLEGRDNQGKRGECIVTVKEAAETCARRSRTVLKARSQMEEDLKGRGLWSLFRDVELPLAGVLAGMEYRGVKVDKHRLEELGHRLDSRLAMLEKESYQAAKRQFNLNSPREVAQVLFDEIGLKPRRKTKTGYSTDTSVLIELSAEHELPRRILEYRQLAKLKSTYVDQLLRFRDPETGKIHASFNQTVTATGRLSSSDPNLQNIPIRDELGAEIRKAFVPAEDGWVMISGDYSQVELRVVAHLSQDENLIAAFREGEDIHAKTAAFIFKVAPTDVTQAMRVVAKSVNFGIIYGMGAQSLAKATGLALEDAVRFLEEHRRTYPRLYGYLDEILAHVREHGYVETVLGRKRALPNIGATEPALRSAAERAAINTPVQGSAADIVKIAMLGIDRQVKARKLRGGILIQVHDEILAECPLGEKPEMEAILYNQMTKAYSLAVPLKVEMRSGRNWYEAH